MLLLPQFRVPSAPTTNPANLRVALAAAVGSRTVEIPATLSLSTHGSRAYRPAKVSSRLNEYESTALCVRW